MHGSMVKRYSQLLLNKITTKHAVAQHVFFIGSDILIALKRTTSRFIILSCIVMILTFNFTMGYAKANSAAVKFEDWAAAQYASVVTATTAVAAGAMHTQQYVLDNATEMYNTAKATWPKMSADMKANFLSSLSQSADGIVAVGDWITAALDSLKNVFGKTEGPDLSDKFTPDYRNEWNAFFTFAKGYYLKVGNTAASDVTIRRHNEAYAYVQIGYMEVGTISGKDKIDSLFRSLSAVRTPGGLVSALASVGISASVLMGDTVIDVDTNSPYNRLDNWIRERYKQQNTPLTLYNPGAQAYSTDGYRLGLSADGQTLLKLPDGIPWEGTADWKQPLLNTIDGTTAVLDTAIGSWIDVATGQKIRDATAAEIAKALGVTLAIAEGILTRAKQEEALREQNKGEGGVTGSLKNPTKAIVWTPLMMAGSAMTTKFPFSIPWDLANQLKVFDVAPKAPVIDINIPNFVVIEGKSQAMVWQIDFNYLNPIAAAVRWFAIIAFDIGLILMIRRIMPE